MRNLMMISYDLPPLTMWGVAKHVVQLVSLSKKHFNVELVSRSKNAINELVNITSDEDADRLITSDLLPFDSYIDFEYLQSWNYLLAKKIINDTQVIPDIIHNHNWMTFPAAKKVADFFDAKLVSTIHFLQKQYNSTYDQLPIDSEEIMELENYIFNQSDRIILFGKNHKQFVLDNYKCNSNKISIIPHGLSIIKDSPEKKWKENISILFVGRLVKEKGILDLIRVVKKLQKKYTSITLEIAGKGPLSHHADLKEDFINYHGFLDEPKLYALYRNSDVFCFPSYTETFGLVSIEAAMHALPIVTSRSKNVEELFFQDEALFVDVESNGKTSNLNEDQLFKNLEKLITEPQSYMYYSKKARSASLRYQEDTMMENLKELYESIQCSVVEVS